jgi:small subunit ribosomal protein S1
VTDKTIDAELGEGIRAQGRITSAAPAASAEPQAAGKPDLSQLSSMLKARWKGNAPAPAAQPEALSQGQVRTFKIVKLDAGTKKIEVEMSESR